MRLTQGETIVAIFRDHLKDSSLFCATMQGSYAVCQLNRLIHSTKRQNDHPGWQKCLIIRSPNTMTFLRNENTSPLYTSASLIIDIS